MTNDIDKTSPHYKGDFGSIYEVNKKFPNGGVAGDYVEIDGWAHYWNADRGTWCVNAQRDSYWDELITGIIEKFKLFKGATYMGVAGLDTVPQEFAGAKMYYFATVAGTYKNFGGLVVPQGINVLYSENGISWVCSTLLEVAQELGMSTRNVVSQKVVKDALDLKANQSAVNEALAKKADKETVKTELGKKFDKASIAQESGDAEDKVMSQKVVSDKLNDLQDSKIDKTSITHELGDSKENVVSQFALPFREIESPDFIKVIVDAEDHLLFTINLDGEVDWGKGIPAPIRAKLQEIINQCQQDKTDLTEAINTIIQVLATSIPDLQEGKVDKEEGKSLIENEIKEQFKLVENDEFIKISTDSEDRILEAFYKETGKPYFPLNEMYHIVKNEEWLYVIIDKEDHILSGIRVDLSTYPDNKSETDLLSKNFYANTFRSLGIPKLSKLDFDYNIIIIDGQSLSVGSETGNVVYQTDRNENCFMLGNNVNVGNSKNVSSEVLQPLSSVSGENCITSAVLYLASILQSNQVDKKIIAISVGQGGTTIEQLSKGTSSGFYENRFLSSLKRIKELCDRDSKTVGVSNIIWMQGESNSNDTTSDYKNKLRNLYVQMRKDIQDIFSQESIPPMLMYGSFSGLFFCHNIPQAMVELSEEHNDMFLSNPIYQLPAYMYGHLSGNGVVWYGSYLGKSLYELNCNSEPEVLKVISAYFINMRTIKLDFCIPVKPLVFDVNMKPKLDNYGFELKKDGSSIPINVKLLGDSIYIILEENADLNSVYSLQYVIHYGNTSKANITYGNVRDSSKCLSKYEYKDDSEEYGSSLYSGWEEIENDGSVFTPVSENVFGTLFKPGDKVSITSHNNTRYFKCISQTMFPPYSFVGGKPENIAYGDRLPLSNWLIPFEKEIDKSLIKI